VHLLGNGAGPDHGQPPTGGEQQCPLKPLRFTAQVTIPASRSGLLQVVRPRSHLHPPPVNSPRPAHWRKKAVHMMAFCVRRPRARRDVLPRGSRDGASRSCTRGGRVGQSYPRTDIVLSTPLQRTARWWSSLLFGEPPSERRRKPAHGNAVARRIAIAVNPELAANGWCRMTGFSCTMIANLAGRPWRRIGAHIQRIFGTDTVVSFRMLSTKTAQDQS
jgi:hypothetical protein